MKKLLIIAGGAAALVVLALGVSIYVLMTAFVPGALQQVVKQHTGRNLAIGGSPRLSLWPETAVILAGVELSPPASMGKGLFARTGELRIGADFSALMRRELKVTDVTLVKPLINLVIDAQGRASWTVGGADIGGGGAGDSGKSVPSFGLTPIRIEDGTVAFLDERSGAAFELRRMNATVALDEKLDGGTISGNLVWHDQRVVFDGSLKSLARLIRDGSPADLTFQSPFLQFGFDGRVRADNGFGLAGQVTIASPDLRAFAHWIGHPLPEGRGLNDISIAGGLDAGVNRIALNKAKLVIDGMTAEGDVSFDAGSAVPHVSAALAFDRIDVNAYLPEPPPADQMAERDDDPQWSAQPISFAALKGFAGDAKLSAGSLAYRAVTTGPVQLSATLDGGVLDARLDKLALYAGEGSAHVMLDGAQKTPSLKFEFTGTGVEGGSLLRDFAHFDRIDGRTTASLSVTTTGDSEREMISSLKGSAQFSFADGAVRGIDAARMIRSLATATLGGWQQAKDRKTDFGELSASFAIEDGIAVTSDLKLEGPLMRVTGIGEIDLLRQALDVKVEPKIVASNEGLPVPVIIRGPWRKPKIYPDVAGILDNPEAAYASLKKLAIKDPETVRDALGSLEVIAKDKLGKKTTKSLEHKGKKLMKKLLGN